MKVYVVATYNYENSSWGPIFANREDAEAFVAALGNDLYSEVEEHEVLDEHQAPGVIRDA